MTSSVVPSDNKIEEASQDKATLSNNKISSSQQEAQIVERIPLYEEDFELTKKEEETSIRVVKKWKHSTKNIEIPIRNEEIFVNGKELGSYDENEIIEIFSKIKDKISRFGTPVDILFSSKFK
jgi:stress response protein YsnF